MANHYLNWPTPADARDAEAERIANLCNSRQDVIRTSAPLVVPARKHSDCEMVVRLQLAAQRLASEVDELLKTANPSTTIGFEYRKTRLAVGTRNVLKTLAEMDGAS